MHQLDFNPVYTGSMNRLPFYYTGALTSTSAKSNNSCI